MPNLESFGFTLELSVGKCCVGYLMVSVIKPLALAES